MIGRPPRSTLFPSTTFSHSDMLDANDRRHDQDHRAPRRKIGRVRVALEDAREPVDHVEAARVDRIAVEVALQVFRSEEHTSELQSQSNLVCRLLLEKKKKTH